MTGATAIATLACALCIGAAVAVLKSGLDDRRRGRPEATGWVVAGFYLLVVPTVILLAMSLS